MNMGWIKTTPDSFEIKTTTTDGLYFIDGISSGVTATPTLLPDLLALPSPEIARSSDTVNDLVTWTVHLKINSNAIPADGKVILTIPENVLFDMGETLEGTYTDTNTAVTVSKTVATGGSITEVVLENPCASLSGGCAVDSAPVFSFTWAKNPPF